MKARFKYDVFISHAWEDKADFVRPLANRLIQLGVTVWFDELSLQLGESLRGNIDRGLADSSYGVVVLSRHFFSKQWPERELSGLVQKAVIEGRKVILPVWHGVTHEMVSRYSLALADLIAAHSSQGVEFVAAEIARVVAPPKSSINPRKLHRDRNAKIAPVEGGKVAIIPPIHEQRAAYARERLAELQRRLESLPEVQSFPALTIFAAGSYARLEASQYSDIDLFFVSMGGRNQIDEHHAKELRLFGKIIEIADDLSFPKFSNDCQYLTILHSGDIVAHLGSPADDHQNYFTARMLLLLEGYCLYGEQVYSDLMSEMVKAYFQDYPDHRHTFQPVFLLNDICRYWKTLLLNYEHKRRSPRGMEDETTKQKVRNFKLKYSRMTTCFASIGALGGHLAPVTEEQVIALARMTPRERLESIAKRVPAARSAVDQVLSRYTWFLEMTGLSVGELEDHFSDKQRRTEMFRQANEYGDAMYKLLQTLDETNEKLKLLRYLVI